MSGESTKFVVHAFLLVQSCTPRCTMGPNRIRAGMSRLSQGFRVFEGNLRLVWRLLFRIRISHSRRSLFRFRYVLRINCSSLFLLIQPLFLSNSLPNEGTQETALRNKCEDEAT